MASLTRGIRTYRAASGKDQAMANALVTGAGRGIGRAIAMGLAQSGFHIIINYHSNQTAAAETRDAIVKSGGLAELLPFDVADFQACDAALKTVFASKDPLHVLVNNAGIRKDGLLAMMKEAAWQQVMDINLTGFYNVTRPVVKQMLRQRYGRIVTITSASGVVGVPGQVNYSASKAGLIGATRALARELASRAITVNAVAPGFIETDMTTDLQNEAILASIPCGRFGTPEDVAHTVNFLCQPESAYITGQVIGVNGGIC